MTYSQMKKHLWAISNSAKRRLAEEHEDEAAEVRTECLQDLCTAIEAALGNIDLLETISRRGEI